MHSNVAEFEKPSGMPQQHHQQQQAPQHAYASMPPLPGPPQPSRYGEQHLPPPQLPPLAGPPPPSGLYSRTAPPASGGPPPVPYGVNEVRSVCFLVHCWYPICIHLHYVCLSSRRRSRQRLRPSHLVHPYHSLTALRPHRHRRMSLARLTALHPLLQNLCPCRLSRKRHPRPTCPRSKMMMMP